MDRPKLRVALVGCGQIADAHLQQIQKVAAAEAVAVCDRHPELARQAAARFGVAGVYDDLGRMLATAGPDVLHVTTPPHTHRAIALQAFAAGVHVYLEKPFAVDADEADVILDAARASGRLVCVGHDQLYDPAWDECRRLVGAGALGRVVHVESVLGYDLAGPFGRVLASEPGHWVRRLPGGLFQNTISHPLYRITDLLPGDRPRVWATWFDGASVGFPNELRVMLRGTWVTGGLVFTSAARPPQRVTRIYGTRRCVEVDFDGQVLRSFRGPRLPGALAKLEVPLRHVGEAARSAGRNFARFLRSDIHYFAGMQRLFSAFYDAILRGGEPPIPYAEIRRVTWVMDEIFRSCRAGQGPPCPGDVADAAPVGSAGTSPGGVA